MADSETLSESSSSEELKDLPPQIATRKAKGVDTAENLTPVKKKKISKEILTPPVTNPSTDHNARKKLETIDLSSDEETPFVSPLPRLKMADKIFDRIQREREEEKNQILGVVNKDDNQRHEASISNESTSDGSDISDETSSDDSHISNETSSGSSTYTADLNGIHEHGVQQHGIQEHGSQESAKPEKPECPRVTAFTFAQETLMTMIESDADQNLILKQVKIVGELYKKIKSIETETKDNDVQRASPKRKYAENEDTGVIEILSDSGAAQLVESEPRAIKKGKMEKTSGKAHCEREARPGFQSSPDYNPVPYTYARDFPRVENKFRYSAQDRDGFNRHDRYDRHVSPRDMFNDRRQHYSVFDRRNRRSQSPHSGRNIRRTIEENANDLEVVIE